MEAAETEGCKLWLRKLAVFFREYKWLIDSYIIEYFTESHWSKLAPTWRGCLSVTDEESLKEVTHLLLNGEGRVPSRRVFPLSLLSFVATCRFLSHPRLPHSVSDSVPIMRSQVDDLDYPFRCHVKPKKQYEIKCLGEVISGICEKIGCKNVIDVGSGKGHLARYLALRYNLNVTTVEAEGCHVQAATRYDSKAVKDVVKMKRNKPATAEHLTVPSVGQLRHVEAVVCPGTSVKELVDHVVLECGEDDQQKHCYHQHKSEADTTSQRDLSCCTDDDDGSSLRSPWESPGPAGQDTPSVVKDTTRDEDGFVMVGLHTCGDLGPTMIHTFASNEQVLGLVSVGCCYMKLTNDSPSPVTSSSLSSSSSSCSRVVGYPMSNFLMGLEVSGDGGAHTLSYCARELACHSLEAYRDRLKGGYGHLKVHCYRAAVEIILRKRGLRRTQLRIAKKVSKLPFKMYARKVLGSVVDSLATSSLPATTTSSVSLPAATTTSSRPLPATTSEEEEEEELCALECLTEEEWRKVVVFFMLRLAMAPCIETAILLDRRLFLLEQGYRNTRLFAAFNPKVSPRNLLLLGSKC